jgi:uncharacterized membrane protein YraQ (UPF0718 family)
MKHTTKKKSSHTFLPLIIFCLFAAVLFFFYPDKLMPSLTSSWDSLSQFVLIFPAIILLMGIFTVVVTPRMIEKNFGKDTGFYGALKALALGSFMSTGPFYLSFPMARTLLQKGARISAVMIFVSAWNGVGIIAEIVELHFMGITFMATRFFLTSICILVLGYAGEYLFFGKKK